MRKSERRHVLVLQRELFEFVHHVDEFFQNEVERPIENDDFRVVGHVAGRRAQMNDGHGGFRLFPERFHVRHHVVTHFAFKLRRIFVIDIVGVPFHFRDLGVGNIEAQLLFRFRERDPQFSPKAEFCVVRKDRGHFLARIARDQRIDIHARIRHTIISRIRNFSDSDKVSVR